MTRVNLSLALCVRVGFIHNKRYTFCICPLGYRFVFIFWSLPLIQKGIFVVPAGKAVWDVLMNLLSWARGSQFKLLHLKCYREQKAEEGQSKAAFSACKRAGMYLHPSIDYCVGGQ